MGFLSDLWAVVNPVSAGTEAGLRLTETDEETAARHTAERAALGDGTPRTYAQGLAGFDERREDVRQEAAVVPSRVEKNFYQPLADGRVAAGVGALTDRVTDSLSPWGWIGLGQGQTLGERVVGLGRLALLGTAATVAVGVPLGLFYVTSRAASAALVSAAPHLFRNAGGTAQLIRAVR